jgi:hypothetical protein
MTSLALKEKASEKRNEVLIATLVTIGALTP